MLPWRKHRRSEEAVRETARESEELRTAEEALEDTEQALQEVCERTSEIREIARTLRRLGERNHFAPMVRDALGGKIQ
jgi:hypothetical protein